jgi:hypothetical protein
MSKFRVEPQPGSILGSLRSIGYNLKTALSDIVDNSIAAEAKKIEIINNDFNDNERQLDWIAIVDDGKGMSKAEMLKALTLGGDGIETERNTEDLGRFGLGLKTASVSQCRKLTLLSKKDNEDVNSLVFDLDHIKNHGWEVFELENSENLIATLKDRLEHKQLLDSQSWTVVFWENLDKIQIPSVNLFYAELRKVRNHFELIYHKFKEIVEMRLNGTPIVYWDPYETAISTEEKFFKYGLRDDEFSLKGHVLKHSSEFQNTADYNNQSKIGTFNQNQGFFVYRNKRLIYSGGWLGLFKKEHHYILARVEINLTNKLESDLAWAVNISKSSVSIPRFAETNIRSECNRIRTDANNTFRYHGGVKKHILKKNIPETTIQPLWDFQTKGVKSGQKSQYKINTKHPLFDNFLKGLAKDKSKEKEFKQLIKYIESYLPIDNIFSRKANNEVEQILDDDSKIYQNFIDFMDIYKLNMSANRAFAILINTEPFNRLSFDDDRLFELGVNIKEL